MEDFEAEGLSLYTAYRFPNYTIMWSVERMHGAQFMQPLMRDSYTLILLRKST